MTIARPALGAGPLFTPALLMVLAMAFSARAEDREFASDRPGKSSTPITVPPGMFQYEADTPLLTRADTDQYSINPVFKFGISSSTDIELGLTPLVADSRGAGIGDVTGRVKLNMFGNDGGTALALIPYIKLPAATRRFGNGQTEGGIVAPLTFDLPGNFSVTVEPEIDYLKNLQNTGYHANFVNVVNIGYSPFGGFTLSGEIYSGVSSQGGGKPVFTNDYAVAYAVTPDFQIDAGVNIGLSSAAPSKQIYMGISQRF